MIFLCPFSDFSLPFSDFSVPFSDFSVPFSDFSVPFGEFSVPFGDFQTVTGGASTLCDRRITEAETPEVRISKRDRWLHSNPHCGDSILRRLNAWGYLSCMH